MDKQDKQARRLFYASEARLVCLLYHLLKLKGMLPSLGRAYNPAERGSAILCSVRSQNELADGESRPLPASHHDSRLSPTALAEDPPSLAMAEQAANTQHRY